MATLSIFASQEIAVNGLVRAAMIPRMFRDTLLGHPCGAECEGKSHLHHFHTTGNIAFHGRGGTR